jgi:hypothetical protein
MKLCSKSRGQTILAACVILIFAGSSQAAGVFISEVSSWSSSNSLLGADWFELTNMDASAIDITGWKMDDGAVLANAVDLNGITSIAAGESVIFIESDDPSTIVPDFKTLWFGAVAPAGLKIGTYTGSGVGLSSGGDGVAIFDSGGVKQAGVTFGASTPVAPFKTFDNAAGLSDAISQLSAIGVNGAFKAFNEADSIGSPGTIGIVPEPGSVLLIVLGVGVLSGSRAVCNRRRARS